MTSVTPELRHLLKLLDDESPVVREAVRQQLAAMRDDLPERLRALEQPLDAQQQRLLSDILAPVCQKELEDAWLSWRWLSTPEAQLEEALRHIASFLSGWQSKGHELAGKLDALAAEAAKEGADQDARSLAEFLFGGRGQEARLRGNSRDYYSAQNSNLLWVLSNGMGNPISLSCVFLLVGRRLGLKVQGCNFPGHFLARVGHEGKVWLVDCFNRGRFMLAEDVAKHHPAANPSMDEIVQNPATVETIVARMLRNLDDSFEREGNLLQRQTVRRLMLKLMED
jgi:regulator of sirC expression with transglutaminase-like and TPR domain